jgi:hypothetical protein
MLSPAFAHDDGGNQSSLSGNDRFPNRRASTHGDGDDEPVDLNDVQLPHPPGSSRASPGGPAASPNRGPRPRDAPAPMSPPVARRLPTKPHDTPLHGAGTARETAGGRDERGRNVDSPPRSLISDFRLQPPESRRRTPAVPAGDVAVDDTSPQPAGRNHDTSQHDHGAGGRYTRSTGETLDVATEEELKLVRELEVLRARRAAAKSTASSPHRSASSWS